MQHPAQTFAQKAIERVISSDTIADTNNRQSNIQDGAHSTNDSLTQSFRARGLAVGEVVDVQPDIVFSHDNTAAIRQIWLQFGQEWVQIPEKIAITLDHAVPAPTTRHALNHAEIRDFVAEQGIVNFFEVGRGICHQVFSEEAIVLPGQMVLGSDSHTPHFGWLGAFGAGIGRSEVATLWATGELWLRVPESIQITLEGDLPLGVTAKDFALRIIGDLGADGGLYASVEFSGSGIEALSIDSRMVLPNMMAEFGVKNAYIPADEKTAAYLTDGLVNRYQRNGLTWHGEEVVDTAEMRHEIQAELLANAIYPDNDAAYLSAHHYNAAELEPYVACPHTVDNVVPVSDVVGTKVQQAFLGTCTNGRLEDIAAAAEIVDGQHVASGTRFVVIPASSLVLKDAMSAGYIQTLVESGAVIGVPGCGPCMGNHMGIPAPNEVTISSANRNFQGRMGTRESEIYLASPAVVAASAIAGTIVGPQAVMG